MSSDFIGSNRIGGIMKPERASSATVDRTKSNVTYSQVASADHTPTSPRSPTELYVDALVDALRERGGTCLLSRLFLDARASKPDDDISVKANEFLRLHPDRFALEMRDNGHYTVHAVRQETDHNFDDPALVGMHRAIAVMATYYRTRPWPEDRLTWEKEFDERMGLSAASQTLWKLRQGKYVYVKDGKDLLWIVPRIYDAFNQMPEDMKNNVPLSGIRAIPTDSKAKHVPTNSKAKQVEQKVPDQSVADTKKWKLPNGMSCHYIDDEATMESCIETDFLLHAKNKDKQWYVAMGCEGPPEALELLKIATSHERVYLFDCRVLGEAAVCRALEPLLVSHQHIKLVHDLHADAVALETRGQITLRSLLDTQLVAEYIWGEMFLELDDLLERLKLPPLPSSKEHTCHMNTTKQGGNIWRQRPIPKSSLEHAAMSVGFLLPAASPISNILTGTDSTRMRDLLMASEMRALHAGANNGSRSICFDTSKSFSLSSAELVKATRPSDGFFGEPLRADSDMEKVLACLPYDLCKLSGNSSDELNSAASVSMERLSRINLDVGRRPVCWVDDSRIFMSDDDDRVVDNDDINHICEKVGEFGSDNRARLDGTLHRFSVMKNQDGKIMGVTVRVGRHVTGSAAMLMDLLMGSNTSILILGEPGSGRTTLLREAARVLAEQKDVMVVDTTNEIAGDGIIPHVSIGLARHMMVPSLDEQNAVMLESVQNHAPHVMVIDEISRPKDVQAARIVKQRGVRIIAAANGNLRKLVKSKDLRGLVGGVEYARHVVVVPEPTRKQKANSSKDDGVHPQPVSRIKAQRAEEPTFEAIVEVLKGVHQEWRVTLNSAKAVDAILNGLLYQAQVRRGDPESGEMRLELVNA